MLLIATLENDFRYAISIRSLFFFQGCPVDRRPEANHWAVVGVHVHDTQCVHLQGPFRVTLSDATHLHLEHAVTLMDV